MTKRGSAARHHNVAFRKGTYFNPNVYPVATEQVTKKANFPRNKPCPCGSNRKYKYCCLNLLREARAAEREATKALALRAAGLVVSAAPDVVENVEITAEG